MEILDYEEMAEWFKPARRAESYAKSYINDVVILSGGGGTNAH